MNVDVVREWLAVVEEDLVAAGHCAHGEPPVPRRAAFFVRQSTEKLVKAVLLACDVRPPHAHDISDLTGLIPASHPERPGLSRLGRFTRYAVVFRYPSEEAGSEPIPEPAHVDEWIREVTALKADFEGWLEDAAAGEKRG